MASPGVISLSSAALSTSTSGLVVCQPPPPPPHPRGGTARGHSVPIGGVLPRKRFFRSRAHINPMCHQFYEYPISPDRARWGQHFPSFADPSARDELAPNIPPPSVADVGCGFGGLTIALARALRREELTVALEIRPRVAEYVRLRLAAYRRHGDAADSVHEHIARAGGTAAYTAGPPPPLPPLCIGGGTHHNASIIKTNAMKFLPCFFAQGTMTRLFFCFADPQFKPSNHRRRIVTTPLLANYAAALAPRGRLYVITDVPDLFSWASSHADAHAAFARVDAITAAADVGATLMQTETEESVKVAREGRTGNVKWAVWERLTDAEADEREKMLRRAGGAPEDDWWFEPKVAYEYQPAPKQAAYLLRQKVKEEAAAAAAAAASQVVGAPTEVVVMRGSAEEVGDARV